MLIHKCSKCGQQTNSGNSNYYLSEPRQGRDLEITLKPGQGLLDGRFTIESCLGRGNAGNVYLAVDNMKPMEVALKVVPVESEFAANQLKHEVELNSRVLDYTHFIRVNDMHSASYGGLALLLVSREYADGGSFRQFLQQNKNDIEKRRKEGRAFFIQACHGVGALHAVGVVHGDLKPENFLFVGGILKVTDLGISRYLHSLQTGDDGQHPGDSVPLLPCTPAYAAPEQILAAHPDDIDCRVDIHALGAILFEIYHHQCRPPFGGTYQQIRQCHLHHVPAPALENVEPSVARVITTCLQKNPADRYSTVSELLADLEGKITEQQSVEQVEQLWQQACQSVDAGNLNAAGRLCAQVLGICPGHDDARCMHEEIQNRFQRATEFYRIIERDINRQSLNHLIALLTEAVDLYPDHPDGCLVQTQLLSVATEYENVVQVGMGFFLENYPQNALTSFERARQLNPGSLAITRLIDAATRSIQMFGVCPF